MSIIGKNVNPNEEYSCTDIGITEQEWYSLVTDPQAEPYLGTLLCFLREQGHKATCASISKVYGESPSYYVAKVNGFVEWVRNALSRFQTFGQDAWLIPMKRGVKTGNDFEWQLRDELARALQSMLKNDLIVAYKNILRGNGSLSADGAYEIYKWRIAYECRGKSPDVIVSRLGQSDCNLIDMQRSKPSLLAFCKHFPEQSDRIISSLLKDKSSVSQRINAFYKSIKGLWNYELGKTVPNDERTASALLASFAPETYPYYKYDVYDLYCRFLGIEKRTVRHCYEHFVELMNDLYKSESLDKELIAKIDEETSSMFHSDVFCAQDVLWQTQTWMKEQIDEQRKTTYWLAGFTLGNIDKKSSFLKEGYWMGAGSSAVNKEIESIRPDDVIVLKSTYTKGKDHKKSAMRVQAVGLVRSCPVKDGVYYRLEVEWKSTVEKEFVGFYGSYRQTMHRAVDEQIIDYAKEQLNMVKESKHKSYIDLLEANYNLVLTGAPGTGKTFLAKEIAREMGAEIKFVQFHPSYDYTDFVEGLRPKNNGDGQIGFERMDGVFKAFCKEALLNIEGRNMKTPVPVPDVGKVDGKPYVLIIDEINRGEASKIFGELFYAIDPGYRGNKDIMVQTQYQNLVPETDVFAKGFFVPENVYIIATMNDIDRSVESMDFAMRRRFTWKEITPEDTEDMLDSLPEKLAGEARDVMRRLNTAVSATDGLGKAYMIGPSYFLKLDGYNGDFGKLWTLNLKPLITEYLRGLRRPEDILEKLGEAYFGKQGLVEDSLEVVDED